ncbi:hypothetical protein L211DRAFT_869513 [Terfezia boudieri ATCC MYA-4762]|uniref:Uncharacterized protein n=1 Tax=Terfezia boudieri ATCC MYA-4762 TaxID=1051890 RepID=A0A3N4LL62_9PEZI|nr:hypothetical protein L211DRAFT_869513 [Terfezia boudieri ATCC MYA-4762]
MSQPYLGTYYRKHTSSETPAAYGTLINLMTTQILATLLTESSMATHNSPPVPFSSNAVFPIQVDNLEKFQSLLDSFKHKLFLNLTSADHVSTSRTIKILETKTYKIGKLTLKRTEKTITEPEELLIPDPVFNPDEYTIEDLWAVLAKQGKLRKLRVLLIGRQVKGSLTASLMNKMSRKRKMRPIINREDTAKWLIIRKAVFDGLTEQEKNEWGLLSGLMVVSKGGRLLDPDYSNKREKTIEERPLLQEVPETSDPLTTIPSINISSQNASEYPERLERRRLITTATEFQPTLASLEQRVRQLEIGSQLAASEQAQNFTDRGNPQLPKELRTNLPAGRSRAGNREASARGPSSSIAGLRGSEFSGSTYDSEDSEDGGVWYGDQAETKSQSNYTESSVGSDLRHECMSPLDWVAFA